MSDIFDAQQEHAGALFSRGNGYRQHTDAFLKQAAQRGLEHLARREEDIDKYKVNISSGDYDVIYQGIQNGVIDEDEAYRLAASIYIADREGLPVDAVHSQLESFLPVFNIDPNGKKPQQFLASIFNSYRMEANYLRSNELKYELMNADDPEWEAVLLKEIKRLEAVNGQLEDAGLDTATARGKALYAFRTIAGTVPYTLNMMLRQVAGTYAGSLAGFPQLGAFAGWNYGRQVEGGALYYDLIARGIPKDIARGTALLGGAASSAVEQLLMGSISKLGKGITGAVTGKKATGKLANYITSHAFSSLEPGGASYNAVNHIFDYLLNIPQEMGEEGGQELVDIFATNIAINIANARMEGETAHLPEGEQEAIRALREIQKDPVEKIAKDIGEAMLGGAIGALGTGIPGVAFSSLGSLREAGRIKQDALISKSEQDFIDKNSPSKNFKGMPEEEKLKTLKTIYAETVKRRDREEARLAAEIKARGSQLEGLEGREFGSGGEDVTPGPYRNPGGSLYTRIEDEKREGGAITGSFRMGDGSRATESNTYGAIDYRIEGGTLSITGVNIADHRSELTDEFFQDFARKFAGADIQWNPETEAGIALRDSLARNNRRGPDAGLNYFESAVTAEDEAYRIRLDKQVQEHARLDADEREAWIQMWEAAGERNGLGLRGTFDRVYADPENIFSETLEDARAAQAKGREIKGATFWKETEKGLRAVVYVAKNGDFSTLAHESLHAYREALKGIDPGLSAETDRVLDREVKREPRMAEGEYRRAREEYLAGSFEKYLYNGAAPEPALKPLFDQIAAFMRRICSRLAGKQEISPEIQKVFDKIFSGYDAREESARDGAEGFEKADANTPAGISESAQRDRYGANKRLNEERPLLDKNNARGDPKPRQTGVTTAQELRAKAARHIEELRSWVNGIAEKYRARVIERPVTEDNPLPLKTAEGIQRKLDAGDDISEILDVMGMTIVAPDLKTLAGITNEMRGRDDVVRIKDRYKTPDKSGYRDILTNIQLSDGMIAEVQINTEQMLAAKQEYGGHKLYEIVRVLGKDIEAGHLTEKQARNDDNFITEMSNSVYGNAYELVLKEIQFNTSSRDITWLWYQASALVQRDGERVLSSFTLNNLKPLVAKAMSLNSRNLSSGSSNDGATTALSGESPGRDFNVSSDNLGGVPVTSVPSFSTIGQNAGSVKGSIDISGVPAIRERYRAAKKTYGYEDTKNVGGEEIEGRWALTGAETPAASHDETSFNETPGFPSSGGATVNDRDYRHDKAAQEAVIKMAGGYDSRALEGVVITDDGIVISGNNRTMSGKRAAREGTDGKYIAALEKKARKYGFTPEQAREYRHPRLVFEVAVNGEYSTELFAQFNQSTRKAQSPMETAVKAAKRLAGKPGVIRDISSVINEHDALSELYSDKKAVREIFNTLQKNGLTGEYERPLYVDENGQITGAGEDLLESVMLGSVLDEGNIRGLQGARAIRQKLVRGITALVENKAMGDYSLIPEMNEAAGIALAVNNTLGKDGKRVYGTVQDYARQQILPGMPKGLTAGKRASIQLAEALESGGQKDFALWYGGLNASLAAAARGQSELFTGAVESKERILDRYVGYREGIAERKQANQKALADPAAGMAAKAGAALDDAGIAKAEAGGGPFQTGRETPDTFFQACGELLEDAARYDTWQEFRNDYEGQAKAETGRQETADWLLTAEPIAAVKDDEIKITGKGKAFIDNIDGYFKEHWESAVTRGDQVILLTREGIRSSLHHGYGKAKINAFAAVPRIIQNGKTIDTQNNWKNRGYDSYTVAAPFKIGGTVYIGEVIINRHKDGKNTFYLHEVTERSKLRGASQAGYKTSAPEGASTKIIARFLEKVKEENAGFHAPADADAAWYETFWKDARAARGLTLFSAGDESASPPEQGDRAFLKDINRENLKDILITLNNNLFARQTEPAAPEAGEDRAVYEQEKKGYDRAQALKARINRELPRRQAWVGIAAKTANGEELSARDYNTLRGCLRKSPRDYRALFAELMEKPEWGLNLAEIKDGLPDTPLSAPRPERPDGMDAENRERLAAAVGDAAPELARGIRDGTIPYDDPRIRAFEQGLDAGIKKADEAVAAAEAEIAGDARKFKGAVQGRALELYREFKEAEEKHQARTTELAQKIRQGEALTGRYQQETRQLLTDFDTARIAFEDYAAAGNLRAEVREELARIDARHAERRRLKDLQKKRNAVREVRRIEQNLIKRIVRKISLKTVAHDQAAAITVVQSFFEPSLVAGVNRRLGTAGGPALREIYMKWRTDADFREDLRKQAGDRAMRIGDILGKPEWDYISGRDKQDLIRLLPKEDWITKLGLKNLEQYREDLIPLDIKTAAGGKAVLGTGEERIAREALGDELYSRIQNKPLEEWTMLDLAELAELVDDLYAEGRENLRVKNEARHEQYEKYRNKLSDVLRITKYQINPGDGPEEQKRKQGEITKILGKYAAGDPGAEAAKIARRSRLERLFGGAYFDANIRRVARVLDNGKDGTFTSLLYWQENDAFNLRERAKMSRRLAVEDSMRKLGIKAPELFRQVTVKDLWGTGRDQVYTAEELLGMKLAARDRLSRQAVIYGNLARETERSGARGSADAYLLERLTDTAEGRFAKVMAAADAFFSQAGNDKYLRFMEAISRDYDGVYDRLNRVNIDVFNQPVWKVEHYFPMFRLEQAGGANERQEVKDLLGLAGAATQWTDNGMTQTRIEMGPQNQTAIELGLYTTWAKSLDRAEHFIAYAPYVRSLNMVFKSRDGKALMQRLQDRYGAGMGNYIKEYINEKASPAAENNRHASDNFVKAMRGRTASAYLAWKISGVLKQLAASPWPYLQHMSPLEYAGACIRFYQNPKGMTDFIKEKSVFMNTRSFDPVVKLIREQQALNRNKALGKIDQFNNLGMKGLEMVDWACVAPGWLVIYNREMARLQKADEGLAADRQLSMADMEYEAAAKADDIVRLTQPSGRDTDQAPMFKNAPQAMKAFLQFTQSLNVIWQNIRYDMPAAVREGQALQAAGCLTGYILAGASLGLLAEGPGDGDDEKKNAAWQRQLLYYSFTQFTDAVPFIGDAVTKAWEQLATGRVQWSGGYNLFPVVNEIRKTAGAVTRAGQGLAGGDGEAAKEAALKALLSLETGFAYSLGLPQSGAKELLLGIGIDPLSGDLDPDFNPGAFAGRREK
jgi:hypothetical protein